MLVFCYFGKVVFEASLYILFAFNQNLWHQIKNSIGFS